MTKSSTPRTAAHAARKREQGMICISHWVPKHRRDEIKAAIAKMLEDEPAPDTGLDPTSPA